MTRGPCLSAYAISENVVPRSMPTMSSFWAMPFWSTKMRWSVQSEPRTQVGSQPRPCGTGFGLKLLQHPLIIFHRVEFVTQRFLDRCFVIENTASQLRHFV